MISRGQWLVLLIGLVVGPGYLLYARLLTGEHLLTEPLVTARDDPAAEIAWPRAMDVDLRPAMNPLAIRVRARHDATEGPRTDVLYVGTLSRGERTLWRSRFAFRPGAEQTVRVATVEVPETGVYRLEIQRLRGRRPALREMSASLRRNVHVADERVYGGGLIAFFASIVWILFAAQRGRETSRGDD